MGWWGASGCVAYGMKLILATGATDRDTSEVWRVRNGSFSGIGVGSESCGGGGRGRGRGGVTLRLEGWVEWEMGR